MFAIDNPRRLETNDIVWDGIALDVTEKREALDALRLAKEKADAAEAQKARLLAGLTSVLSGPSRELKAWMIEPGHLRPAAEQLNRVAAAIDQAMLLLNGTLVENTAHLASADGRDPDIASLTDRQRDVFTLLADGYSNRQIAERLGLTEGTVKLHVGALLRALGLSNRSQAAALAARRMVTAVAR